MNFKPLSFLTISLAASISLAPIEKAFSQPQEHQMNAEEVQHLICVKEAQHLQCTVESKKLKHQGTVQKAKVTESSKSSLVTVVPQNPVQQRSVDQINQYQTTNTVDILIFLILICSSGLGLFLYKHHRTNRITVLRQNIEVLERLWKTSNIQ